MQFASNRKMLKMYQDQTKLFPLSVLKKSRWELGGKYIFSILIFFFNVLSQHKLKLYVIPPMVCFLHFGKYASNLKKTILSFCGLFHSFSVLTKLILIPDKNPSARKQWMKAEQFLSPCPWEVRTTQKSAVEFSLFEWLRRHQGLSETSS